MFNLKEKMMSNLNVKRKLVEFDFLSEMPKKKYRIPLKQMNKIDINNNVKNKKIKVTNNNINNKDVIAKDKIIDNNIFEKEKHEKEKHEKEKHEKERNEKEKYEKEKYVKEKHEKKKYEKEKHKKEKFEKIRFERDNVEKNSLEKEKVEIFAAKNFVEYLKKINFKAKELNAIDLNKEEKVEEKVEEKSKIENDNKKIDNVNKTKETNLKNTILHAKNFCVGINLLDDDFIENALLGQLNWKEVLKHDRLSNKKNQELFTQLLKKNKVFKKRNSKSNVVYPENFIQNKNFPRYRLENFTNQKLLSFMSKQVLYTNMYTYQNLSFLNNLPEKKNDIEMISNLIESLNINTKFADKIRFPLKCLNCSYTTTSASKFFIHMSYHKNHCSLCSKSFKNVLSYFTHINRHLKNIKSDTSMKLDFRCKHCYTYFKDENQLTDHFFFYYLKHDGEHNKFICKICHFSGNNYQDFKQHSSTNHSFVSCPFCKTFLNDLNELEQHTFIHHNLYSNFFQCDLCTKKFSFKNTLEKHYKSDHCIILGKNFKKCYICSFNFTGVRSEKIIEHLANHCNIYLYSCELCDLRTNSENEMYAHTMKINCDKSLVAFGKKNDLSYLWFKLAKQVKEIESDFIITDQLKDAILSIL